MEGKLELPANLMRGEVSRLVEAALDVPVVASTGNAALQEADL